MGIMFSNSQEGRVYAALGACLYGCLELGFELYNDGLSSAESTDECRKGLDELHNKAWTLFLSAR